MLKSMAAVGILGPRIQVEEDKDPNKILLDNIVNILDKKYTRDGYYIVSTGCDEGFSKDVFWYCKSTKIKLVQLDAALMTYNLDRTNKKPFANQQDFLKILKCRHAAIFELCGEFHLKVFWKSSIVDDMINRVKLSDKPYHLYDFENSLIEHRGDFVTGLKGE